MKRNGILTCDQKPYSPQHNEVYENNAYAEMLVFFISHCHLFPMSHKRAVHVTHGNSFSNQWSLTVLETTVFKYNF